MALSNNIGSNITRRKKYLITVIGSINMDLVISVDEIPNIGETMLGNSMIKNPGGKGANQAAAIGKLGDEVYFGGCIGNDENGEILRDTLADYGINTEYVKVTSNSSGIAIIQVDRLARNNIVVVPGANFDVTESYIDELAPVIESSDIVVFQLEIPLDTVAYALKIAKNAHTTTVLNAAPALNIPNDIIKDIDILIMNEHELERISGVDCQSPDEIIAASEDLRGRGAHTVITTLGENGVYYNDGKSSKAIKAHKVKVVDTTAAGDSFIGGFVHHYAISKNIEDAIEFGQKVAAYTIGKKGAQQSMPYLSEIV